MRSFANVNRIKCAKLFIFLGQVRHQLFDDEFQTELAKIFDENPKGQPPIPPAKLALVTILQAYTGASDDEAIEPLLTVTSFIIGFKSPTNWTESVGGGFKSPTIAGVTGHCSLFTVLMDKRWQLVLDCLECEQPPLSKPTIVRFRAQLMKRRLDRRLIQRTVELAKQTGGFGSRNLRAALDSSPLWGAAND